MTVTTYQRFDTPAIAPEERFEYWRSWFSQAVDAPTWLEPVNPLPADFRSSAAALGVGQVDIVEIRCAPATGSWPRDAIEPADRLRLALLAPTPGGTGHWHGRESSLTHGSATLLGRTYGRWYAPGGLRAIQVNVPRVAVAVSEQEIDRINDPARLMRDPTFARFIRPLLLGLAGHLETLTGTDATDMDGLWISLMNMLVRSLRGEDIDGTDTAQARRLQIQRYVRAHLSDPRLSPARIAAALHVSRRTLYTAMSSGDDGVAAEIRRQRLERAREMLLDPTQTLSVAEIAASVGLPHAAHFSRLFRARYGHSPSQLLRARATPNGGSSATSAHR